MVSIFRPLKRHQLMPDKEDNGEFTGFDRGSLALLTQMPTWNEQTYAKNRDALASGLREPGWALISQLAEALDAPLATDKRSSVSPFHRDLRFAKAGTPKYKDHLIMTAWEGANKKTAATLWLRVDSTSVGFASGLVFSPAQRDAFRKFVGGKSGEAFAQELKRLEKKHRASGFDLAGASLKKVPAGFGSDHPRADLLKMTAFQARFHEPHPPFVDSARLFGWCKKRLEDLLKVHRFLVDKVQ
jgi:uncharacterized protein (DUF2461 family)